MRGRKHIFEIAIFSAIFIVICSFIFNYSPFVQVMYAHDVPCVLDGVWRMENGQLPHKDFSSILGYSFLLQQFIFLKLFDYNLIGFTVSSVCVATVALIIFLALYKSKFFLQNSDQLLRIYLFLLIVALGLGQYNFGIEYDLITYANLYNRYAFVCLLILMLLFFSLSGKKVVSVRTSVVLLLSALLINYLIFSKATYFFIAIAVLLLLVILKQVSFKIFTSVSLASTLVFVLVLLISQENISSIISDYRSISAVRSEVLFTPAFINLKLNHFYNEGFILSVLFLLFQLIRKKIALKLLLLPVFFLIAAIAVHFTNAGIKDIVLLSFIPVLFILPVYSNYKSLLSFKILLLASSVFLAKNFLSIYTLAKAKNYQYQEVKSGLLSGFYVDLVEIPCRTVYSDKIMRGVDLINRNNDGNTKVLSFTFENPFPLLTRTVPPKNVLLVWQYGTTFSNKVYPPASKVFSDVNLLIVPKCDDPDATQEMRELYQKELENNFAKVDEDKYWYLLRKVKPVL